MIPYRKIKHLILKSKVHPNKFAKNSPTGINDYLITSGAGHLCEVSRPIVFGLLFSLRIGWGGGFGAMR